jgi:hypothetical protein
MSVPRNYAKLAEAICQQLALPKYAAGRALGLGRRATDNAVREGKIPIIDGGPKQSVPCSWLREQLRLEPGKLKRKNPRPGD